MTTQLAKVLFVDDEEGVLIGINRLLHARYDISLASSPADALQLIEAHDFDVVVSDMRMPQMSGTELLMRVRARRPDTTRVILSGHSDLEAAAAAINDGRVFRFLLKPARRETLIAALDASIEQRRLLVAEHELLEHTLTGSINALSEALAVANPEAFGRARRLERIAAALAKEAGLPRLWPLKVAAALSQMGAITLPPEVSTKWNAGEELTAVEQAMVERSKRVPQQLLRHIPRIEPVIALLDTLADEALSSPMRSLEESALRMAVEVERRHAAGEPIEAIITALEGDPRLEGVFLDALKRIGGLLLGARPNRKVTIQGLQPGMVLVEDVRTRSGALLITRGREVSDGLMVRLRNFAATVGVKEPLTVAVPEDETVERAA